LIIHSQPYLNNDLSSIATTGETGQGRDENKGVRYIFQDYCFNSATCSIMFYFQPLSGYVKNNY
jgi:hypothetical protein